MGRPENGGGAPASPGVKRRRRFWGPQGAVGVSDTVHPLGTWEPSDRDCAARISRMPELLVRVRTQARGAETLVTRCPLAQRKQMTAAHRHRRRRVARRGVFAAVPHSLGLREGDLAPPATISYRNLALFTCATVMHIGD